VPCTTFHRSPVVGLMRPRRRRHGILTLDEVIRLGLENSKVLRDLGGSVLRTPALAQTVHDPAIQATDPRFGMEGALAAFDAQVTSRLVAQHNDRAYNNRFWVAVRFYSSRT